MLRPPMNRFQRDTAVRRVAEDAFEARIDPGWWIVRGPNGGYVAAILLRALGAAVDDAARVPRSFTVHYTSPPTEGTALVRTTRERVGRGLTTVTARLEQEGRLRALALAAFSRDREGPSFDHTPLPDVPPPERCQAPDGATTVPLRERYESRPVLGIDASGGADEALVGGWIRLREAPGPVEPALIAAYADGWPPAVFALLGRDGVPRGAPTVDLSVHFRTPYPEDADPTDFVFVSFRSRYAEGGFVEEDGTIWTRDGVLLAQSRQLAVLG